MTRLRGWLASLDVLDVMYLVGIAAGWLGFWLSPWPWTANVYLAACMFGSIALHLLRERKE